MKPPKNHLPISESAVVALAGTAFIWGLGRPGAFILGGYSGMLRPSEFVLLSCGGLILPAEPKYETAFARMVVGKAKNGRFAGTTQGARVNHPDVVAILRAVFFSFCSFCTAVAGLGQLLPRVGVGRPHELELLPERRHELPQHPALLRPVRRRVGRLLRLCLRRRPGR